MIKSFYFDIIRSLKRKEVLMSNIVFTDYVCSFDNKEIEKDIPDFKDIKNMSNENHDIEINEEERGFSFLAVPKTESYPFINIKATNTSDGIAFNFVLGWTKKDSETGKMPDFVSSSTAYRENNLPSMISGKVDENNNIKLKEVLTTSDDGFNRYLFNKYGIVSEMWFFKSSGESKIYELNKPYFIKYHQNGNPKEVWFFNPKANNMISTLCTIRMKDDKPVVISFFEDGDLEALDYTGYVFAPKLHSSINNFPFNSRASFYEPSYIEYNKTDDYGYKGIKYEKYFIGQKEHSKESMLNTVGSWGIDISSKESIESTLKANPAFEDMIRNMLGVYVITDEELDESYMLHEIGDEINI